MGNNRQTELKKRSVEADSANRKGNHNHPAPSTTAIALHYLSALPKPTFYPDGVGIGGFNLRLSNVPANLHYLSHLENLRKSSIATITLLLSAMPRLTEAGFFGENDLSMSAYFSNSNQTSDYKFSASSMMQGAIDKVKEGACGVREVSITPVNFQLIQEWTQVNDLVAQLSRAIGDPVEKITENCLKEMIEKEFQALPLHSADWANLLLAIGLASAGIAAIVGIPMLCRCIRDLGQSLLRRQEPELTQNTLTQVTVVGERQPLLNVQMVLEKEQTALLNTQTLPKEALSNEDKLNALVPYGFLFENIPKNFICLGSRSIMDKPILLADGHSIDESTLKANLASDPNAQCYIVRTKKLTDSQIPNHALRGAIEDYVALQQRKYTEAYFAKKQKKAETETRMSQTSVVLFAEEKVKEGDVAQADQTQPSVTSLRQ
jgi:hypothetical protein